MKPEIPDLSDLVPAARHDALLSSLIMSMKDRSEPGWSVRNMSPAPASEYTPSEADSSRRLAPASIMRHVKSSTRPSFVATAAHVERSAPTASIMPLLVSE